MAASREDLPRLTAVVERQRRELALARAEAGLAALEAMAKGALMERHQCTAAEAARQLADMAATAGLPLPEMAAAVLGQESPPPRPPEPPECLVQLVPADPLDVAAAERAKDGAELVGALAEQLRRRSDAAAAAVWLLEPDGALEMLGFEGLGGTESSRWRRLPPQFDCAEQRVASTGAQLWWQAGPPARDKAPSAGPFGPGAARAVLPLNDRTGTLLGVVEVWWPAPRDAFDDSERARMADTLAGFSEVLGLRLAYGPVGSTAPSPAVFAALDQIADSLLVAAPLRDADGNVADFAITNVSPGYVDPAGRRPGELTGLTLLEAYPASVSGDGLFARASRVLASGRDEHVPGTVTAPLTGATDAVEVADLHAGPFFAGVVFTWRGAGEIERIAELLGNAERLGRMGGWEENLSAGTVRWTEAVFALFGLDPAQAAPIPTADLHNFVIAADRVPVRRFRQTLLRDREPAVAVFRIVRPGDMVIRQIRIFAEPVVAGGDVVALRGAFQDVSAHYHTQVALAATRDQLAGAEQRAAEEHQLAIRLQRAIMPQDPPPVEAAGVDVAVRYRPAEAGHLVAGDWYDAVLLPGKDLLLVVGDITGHGIDAVTGMIAARNALRGLAATGGGPAELLRSLNYAACHLTEGVAGTVVCGRYDPDSRVLRWARAGHLPPILVRDGTAELLPLPGGVLLGLDPDAEYEEAELQLRGGDTLLLFTDGLVERRSDSISDALHEFAMAAVPAGPDAASHADRILSSAVSDTGDDACLVTVRILLSGGGVSGRPGPSNRHTDVTHAISGSRPSSLACSQARGVAASVRAEGEASHMAHSDTVSGDIAGQLERDLASQVDGEVRFDAGTRAAYSTDGSNFRQVPIGVVLPRTVDAAVAAAAVCGKHSVPLLSRGGGTSLAGQCTNTAVVIDWTKYCNRVVDVDPAARTCTVEPGIVLDVLNDQLKEHGLRFGPEPATHMNCTIGGMIGNNSCGATAQRTGKVVDNIEALEVLLYDGTSFWCGQTSDAEFEAIERRGDQRARIYRRLRKLRDSYAEQIKARYPDIPRRVSGYNLDSLLPEHGFDVAGLLVGSESTLVTVLRAKLKLVPVLTERSLVVLGYPSVDRAADAVPHILPHEPIALEGLDHRLIHDEQLKHMNQQALADLPEGAAFLMVQFGGDSREEVDKAAERMLDALHDTEHDPDVSFYDDPALEDELWQVREAGLGATAHLPHRRDTFEGWEDSAVHPDRLGDYLRDLRRLYDEFDYSSDSMPSLYGHFGQGCVHTRIPFDLYMSEGVAVYRRFMERAADLVVSHGGSLSGEHGDGQSRGELLSRMFGDDLVAAFGEVKQIFDPGNRMNPGKVVFPAGLDEHLRLGGDWAPATPQDLFFHYPHDGGSFAQAANRCVGVGKCRQHANKGGSVMCPSYQVTHEEEHSTRGRARLLFEMLDGHGDSPVSDGWRSEAVRDALDLCLACKGCKSDCPADVDMATYKAEFLAHHWQGRQWRRPRSDIALGWLPLTARAVSRLRLTGLVNTLAHTPGLHRAAMLAGGLEDREVPLFASQTLQQWYASRGPRGDGRRGTVVLWPDTFSNYFHPHVGQAAVEVLEGAGWRVEVPAEPVCCGLTWISTGQLATGKRILSKAVAALAPHVRAGGYVVGLEPSCTAVFRSDAAELFPDDQDVRRLRDHTFTLAELLTEHTPGWVPPMVRRLVLTQVHCHQHAIMGWDADAKLLADAGAEAEHLESGCCGLAGNFGFQRGHLDVSVACAERVMLPRLREAPSDAVILADGFSCRTQIHELDSGGREAMHLAELLAAAGDLGEERPEQAAAPRPAVPRVAAKAAVLAGAAGLTGATAALWSLRRSSS